MPAGNPTRLHAVLRAGENRQHVVSTGIPLPPPNNNKAGLVTRVIKPGGKVARKPSAPDTGDDDGSASIPASPSTTKNGTPTLSLQSSERVKDLIKSHDEEANKRRMALEASRVQAEECAKNRALAVAKFAKEQADAAKTTITKLEQMLKAKEAEIDRFQDESRKAAQDLAKQREEGGAANKKVEEYTNTISNLKLAKDSLQRELEALKKSSNQDRDEAKKLAENQLKQAQQNAAKAIADCKSKADKAASEEAGKLTKILKEKEELLKQHTAESAQLAKLTKEKEDQLKAFQEAARKACDALKNYTNPK